MTLLGCNLQTQGHVILMRYAIQFPLNNKYFSLEFWEVEAKLIFSKYLNQKWVNYFFLYVLCQFRKFQRNIFITVDTSTCP